MQMELPIVYGIAGLAALVLVLSLSTFFRLNTMIRRYREFMAGGRGVSLEGTLSVLFADLQKIGEDLAVNRQQMSVIKAALDQAIQAVGVVRFNAFQDTGSDLSFAVALLDGKGSGVVISSIYGREESRTYAKSVVEGTSSYLLSGEEQEAIQKAVGMLKETFLQAGKI